MKTVAYTRSAAKALAKLPVDAREALIGKLRRYAETGAGDVKAMQGEPAIRIRAGDYRLVCEETATIVTVIRAGHRRDIYR